MTAYVGKAGRLHVGLSVSYVENSTSDRALFVGGSPHVLASSDEYRFLAWQHSTGKNVALGFRERPVYS